MARFDLDRLRTHPLGHEALQVGIDRPVLGGHGVEGRLGAPSGIHRLFRGQRPLERLLNCVEDARLLRRRSPAKLTPFCWRRAITFDQQEPSANSPCTKTTFLVFVVWALATRLSRGRAGEELR